jgi:hypothetical protein
MNSHPFMKALFFTLLVFGGLFLGYDYFMAPVGTKVVFKSLNVAPPKASSAADEMPVTPVAPTEVPKSSEVTMVQETKPTPPPAPTVAPTPAAPTAEANGFVPPKFEPLEVLTNNWTKIPPSAFPRSVKLTQPVEFKMSVGGSKMPAGGSAVALAFDGGRLSLAPTEASTARAIAPIDSTDLKSIISAGYEEWKVLRTNMLRKQYAKKLELAKSQGVVVAPSGSLDAAGKPIRNPDGTYPILNASLSSGQVTEIKPSNVHRWGEATQVPIEGKTGWSVKVNYDATTIFGLMPVEAQALILDGRVKGWYYTGSGEEVP